MVQKKNELSGIKFINASNVLDPRLSIQGSIFSFLWTDQNKAADR